MRKKVKRRTEIRKKIVVLGGMLCAVALLTSKLTLQAETSEQIRSNGIFHYTDESGEEVIFDAEDLQMLFQSAAKGKNGILQALGGVGTKFVQTGEKYQYSRNPDMEAGVQKLHNVEALQKMSFATLTEALGDSQKLPQEYTDTYSFATSDNLTLGNAAWADGSLLLGNNHDLLENYAKGWMEGAGYTSMTPIKDENGNVTGYLFGN